VDALHTAEQHNELGNSLKRAGNVTEAVEHYREALRLKPRWADAHNNLGLALRALGDLPAALAQFRLAVRVRADHAEARNNLGVTLSDLGQLAEAAATYQLVLKHRPSAADTHNNLGVVLVQRGKRADAIAHYRRALEIRPNYAEAHNNLGNALRHEGKFEEAEACLREALRLRPEYAEAHNNLAIILMKQERVEEAIANYRQALRMKPDYPDAHKNLGLALLGKGDYAAGWKEYEYRWGTKEMPARKFDCPAWDGGPLDGKTILLYAEQGLGDTVQFIRFAALVAERGGKVIVECHKALLGIFGRCRGIDRLVAQGDKLPPFDVHAPLMSVPGIVGQDSHPAVLAGTMEIVPHGVDSHPAALMTTAQPMQRDSLSASPLPRVQGRGEPELPRWQRSYQ
jgi:Flp pilus assembly protein TadD